MPDIGTIRETASRLRSEGLPVSEYSLRRWVRIGAFPVAKCGSKALIYYPNVIAYIRNGSLLDRKESENGIRRLEVQP